jgi:hypothetical protein
MNVSHYWDRFINFLTHYDMETVTDLIRNLDWAKILHTPLFWIVAIPVFCWVIWKRYFRLLLLVASTCLFLILVQQTLPPSGDAIPLDRLLVFVGGCVVLIGLNFYFLFIRGD